ncbi:hypothetical protein [Flavobacterium humidisoli]|uniref:Bacteriocin-type signal sequence-containing protein n=1 Tax=Flavobacterium humidisoli TaxID=2937442 RepID=A0ABY4LW92_9FLAO|nr:hypothetical protein [Flavobacterium humidisoli]UPZ17361.1 hypothetical protein M0M44_08410 [Flavobacterium humidisoli]
MDNLKKMNFTELDPSEMKLVQGGNWVDDLVVVLGSLEAVAAYLGKTVDEVRAMLGL